jgi:hypothetical protein
MKRLILLIVVVMLVFWVLARHRAAVVRPVGPGHRNGPHYVYDREHRRHVVVSAGHEVKRALKEAGHDIRHAVGEASEDVHNALGEMRDALFPESADDDDPYVVEREDAEGLPVKIVPGTRTTEAKPVPPAPPGRRIVMKRDKSGKLKGAKLSTTAIARATGAAEIPQVEGKISATPENADNQARDRLREVMTTWLEPDVPSSWSLPERELDKLVVESSRETFDKDYGTMYITHLKLDTTRAHRARLVKLYNREVVGHRLITLGGSLTFILMCLAAISGYIRADEATKGYYTNRLRTLAAVAVGAGGVLIYQIFT